MRADWHDESTYPWWVFFPVFFGLWGAWMLLVFLAQYL